ncbi:hypothetical protein B0H34DRAFT_802469 [Crassisporium funariophilum]|nr:hypothetical protein B0H34DRAFT_802469 [Crassisporium funariophilum]
MANFVQFIVDDTSPAISYSPFRDTFSAPNLSSGWNPYYNSSGFAAAQGDVGDGTSLHITSFDGASLVVQWHGTGIHLLGNATSASYSITLDGQPFTPAAPSDNRLATIDGLEDAPHSVTLTAKIPSGQDPINSSMIVFDQAVIISSPASVSANVSFKSQTLNDNDIAFLGRWSFETAPSNASFHTSNTPGDRAVTTFNGTTFLLQGITSPHSGNYTVNLDNVTTVLSGRSSFTAYDSLLFFASGLDSNINHSVEVKNLGGGDLSLLVDGFTTFIPYSPLPPPPSASQTPGPGATTSMTFAKGTIAAFALAGILGFLLLTGVLFFCFVYRPRRRRINNEHLRRNPKEREAGMVLDIAPRSSKVLDFPEIALEDKHRNSSRGGFARWRREAMEGNAGGMSLPLHFRHSNSMDEKRRSRFTEIGSDELCESPSTDSSTRRKARAKSKGKARQITGRSWSPSITLDLPLGRNRQRASTQVTSPGVISLDYVSTFHAAEYSPVENPKTNFAPPSYSVSVSNRDSNSFVNSQSTPNSNPSSSMPSVPRSVSPSPGDRSYPRTHNRESSRGFLLHNGEANSDQDSPTADQPQGHLSPPRLFPTRPSSKDQGSVLEYSTDDNPSILGSSSVQRVILSLSPRTSIRYHSKRHDVPESPGIDLGTRDLSRISLSQPREIEPVTEVGSERPLPQTPTSTSDDGLFEVKSGVFLSVRSTSPFQIDFDVRSAQRQASESSADGIYFTPASSGNQSRGSLSQVKIVSPSAQGTRIGAAPDFVQGTSRVPFRMGPLIRPTASSTPPRSSSNEDSEGVTSFLDLTNSSDGSVRSRAKTMLSEQSRRGNGLHPPMQEVRSRWSNTTVPSMMTNNGGTSNGSSGESAKVPASLSEVQSTGSSMFPISVQVDIPPSPHHVMDSPRRSQGSALTQNVEHLHVHPPLENLESPTESIPMSVSDLHFRHSDSEENPDSRRNTNMSFSPQQSAHPPLPGTSPEPYRSRPFDPSILVSRVLGLPSPTSTVTVRPGHSRSASITVSAFSPFPSPRYGLNPSNDRLNSEDSSRTNLHEYAGPSHSS